MTYDSEALRQLTRDLFKPEQPDPEPFRTFDSALRAN
jgi:hypothetical protein